MFYIFINIIFQSPTRLGFGGNKSSQKVDMRPILVQTGTRLLHSRHPKLVTTVATIKTLHNAVNHVPGKLQKLMNQLGDSYGQKTSRAVLDAASEGHDEPVLKMKTDVESLYLGSMVNASARSRKSLAYRCGINGYSFFGDNVGKVSSSLLCPHHISS